MLRPCPECGKMVSSHAHFCPACGYTRKNKVTRRLPNGFGSITKVSSKKVSPYYVRVTVGKDEKGRAILRSIKPKAFFQTYEEAYLALVEWHKNPYDENRHITIKELYERWSKIYYEKIESGSAASYKTCWPYCKDLYYRKISELKAYHLKDFLQSMDAPITIKRRTKSMLNLMYDYALEYDMVPMNYARNFKSEVKEETNPEAHKAFTKEELQKLRENITDRYAAMMLIQCYTGFRPQELCKLEIENINLDEWSITGGMKTANGRNRKVPIHSSIKNIIKRFYDEAVEMESAWLFNDAEKGECGMNYRKYHSRFHEVLAKLDLDPTHKPHDPRKTFVTNAKSVNMDEFAIKRIVGHSIQGDITEAVYTERPYTWLVSEMEKME